MPHSSFRPKKSEAPRWGQWLPMRPTWPLVSRKAINSSPSSFTRTGGPSGLGSSVESRAGIQYCRMSSPTGVPGPTRVSSSFSSRLAIDTPPSGPSVFPILALGLPSGRRRHVEDQGFLRRAGDDHLHGFVVAHVHLDVDDVRWDPDEVA